MLIGDIPEKEMILEIIRGSVNWLKTVRNVPLPTLPHKYGTMDADDLYINVYKNDARGNKELLSNNDNFACFVYYNIDGKTALDHGGLSISI